MWSTNLYSCTEGALSNFRLRTSIRLKVCKSIFRLELMTFGNMGQGGPHLNEICSIIEFSMSSAPSPEMLLELD